MFINLSMINKVVKIFPFLKNRKAWIIKYRIPLGIILIILGIAGLFLPVLQGIAMILLGIALLLNEEKNERGNIIQKRKRES